MMMVQRLKITMAVASRVRLIFMSFVESKQFGGMVWSDRDGTRTKRTGYATPFGKWPKTGHQAKERASLGRFSGGGGGGGGVD